MFMYDPTFFAPASRERGGDGITPRMGGHRARFLMESVEGLRAVSHFRMHG